MQATIRQEMSTGWGEKNKREVSRYPLDLSIKHTPSLRKKRKESRKRYKQRLFVDNYITT